jgi:hypothetical protein
MLIPDDLLRFVRAHHDDPTLSVYVEAAPHDPASRRAWRVHLKKGIHLERKRLAPAPREEREAFERCATEVLARIPDGDTPPATSGWACFCAADGDVVARAMPEIRSSLVSWGRGVRMVPYLRVATEPSALVVLLDREHARLGRWHDLTFEPLATLTAEPVMGIAPHTSRPPKPGFHSGTRGVTGADEAQRIHLEMMDRLLSQVRHKLPILAHPGEPILVGGATEATTILLHSLSPELRNRCQVVPGARFDSDGGTLAVALQHAMMERTAAQREQRIASLREDAHPHGRAAVGLGPAQAAATFGALAELIFSERAWQDHPAAIEQLVEQALLSGAAVQMDRAPGAVLDGDADGVIAGLRFPIPSLVPSPR